MDQDFNEKHKEIIRETIESWQKEASEGNQTAKEKMNGVCSTAALIVRLAGGTLPRTQQSQGWRELVCKAYALDVNDENNPPHIYSQPVAKFVVEHLKLDLTPGKADDLYR